MIYSYIPEGIDADPGVKEVMNSYIVRQLWRSTFINNETDGTRQQAD